MIMEKIEVYFLMVGNKEGWDIPGPFYLSIGAKYIYCVCMFDLRLSENPKTLILGFVTT